MVITAHVRPLPPSRRPRLIERAFGAEFSQIPRELVPRWNIAPTQTVPIVRSRPRRELRIMRKGERGERELATIR